MVKKGNGTPVMLVLPASHKVNFSWLQEVLHSRATLEQEREFRDLFPGARQARSRRLVICLISTPSLIPR